MVIFEYWVSSLSCSTRKGVIFIHITPHLFFASGYNSWLLDCLLNDGLRDNDFDVTL